VARDPARDSSAVPGSRGPRTGGAGRRRGDAVADRTVADRTVADRTVAGPVQRPDERAVARTAPSTGADGRASPTDRATRDPEADLYHVAHRRYFAGDDLAAAEQAWSRYLSRYPDGRFAPEAAFNRALCLVRLGRTDEAIAALERFIADQRGGYRVSEARALLARLRPPR
jgi:TolA-binding protein